MKYLLFLLLFVTFVCSAQRSDFKDINFDKVDSIAKIYQDYSLRNLPLLVHSLTHNLSTDVEKFRAIYMWICFNIEADHYFAEKTTKKIKKLKYDSVAFSNWNKETLSYFFKRLLTERKTICSGYAYLLKELSSLAGINCQIIDGYKRTPTSNLFNFEQPNHSWNAVLLNNKWYLADATLASGYYFVNEDVFVKNYNDGYFLAEPMLFAKSHYPLDKNWLLLYEMLNESKFVEAPIIYNKTFLHKVVPMYPSKFESKIQEGDEMVFALKILDELDINEIHFHVVRGFKSESIKSSDYTAENGVLEFKYQFKNKGIHDVQIAVGNDIVVSYVVEVSKPKDL